MNEKTILHHVALQYFDRAKAEIFFTKILNLTLKKTFILNKELSNNIFGIQEEVIVDVYSNKDCYFEIFITKRKTKYSYEHISIEVSKLEEFIKKCRKYNIKPMFIKKGEKTLLFVKDYVGNLFEIKEIKR
jgi:hypothetical protein